MDIPSGLVGELHMITNSRLIGRKGGKARSEQKSLAARQNIRLRWHRKREDGVIPLAALIDGAWYRGRGRTASVAVWDEHSLTFHTVGMNTYREPKDFPRSSRRVTRIKQEGHSETKGGSFCSPSNFGRRMNSLGGKQEIHECPSCVIGFTTCRVER